MVPLSERERRILEEIEKNLLEEDRSFAGGLRRRGALTPASRRRFGAGMFVGGIVLLLAFFITRNIIIGVGAFGTMVAGMVLVAGSIATRDDDSSTARSRPGDAARKAFERWDASVRKRRKRL